MTSYIVPFGGERLDRIAKTLLQSERQGTVEALLSANPGLGAIMEAGTVPAGTVIRAPAAFTAAKKSSFILAWE